MSHLAFFYPDVPHPHEVLFDLQDRLRTPALFLFASAPLQCFAFYLCRQAFDQIGCDHIIANVTNRCAVPWHRVDSRLRMEAPPCFQPALIHTHYPLAMSHKFSFRAFAGLGAALALFAFTSCSDKSRATHGGESTISGTVTYRPRIALPPDAVVRVSLEDVNRADAKSTVLAEQTILTDGRQVPIPFELKVADSSMVPNGRYALRAQIHGDGGALLWTTNEFHSVPSGSAPAKDVELVVVQTADDVGKTAGDSTRGPLVGPTWRLVSTDAPDGRAVTPAAGEAYTIAFGADGRYNGEAHCNRYGGEFKSTPTGTLSLTQGLSTLAACAPPSSANVFMGVLNAVTSFTRSDDSLRLTSGTGGTLVFTRSDSE